MESETTAEQLPDEEKTFKLVCDECEIEYDVDLPPISIVCGHFLCQSCLLTKGKLHTDRQCSKVKNLPIRNCPTDPHKHTCTKEMSNYSLGHGVRLHILIDQFEKCLENSEMEDVTIKELLTKLKEQNAILKDTMNDIPKQPRKLFKSDNPSDCIEEILLHLQAESKVYYYFDGVNIRKYGEVSIEDDIIYFHSQSIFRTLDENVILVSLEYILEHFQSKIKVFLKIQNTENYGVHDLRIALFKTSLRKQFVDNCLGIALVGHVYKGARFNKGKKNENFKSILSVDLAQLVVIRDYRMFEDFSNEMCNTGKYFVNGDGTGNFDIICMNEKTNMSAKAISAIGKIISAIDRDQFVHPLDLRIVDCGIYFKYR